MITLDIDPDFRNYLETVRKIGRERMRPLGIECDRKDEPLPPDHPYFQEMWDIMPGGNYLRHQVGEDPSKPGTAARKAVLTGEEIGYWDRGMATITPGPGLGSPSVMAVGTPEQKKRWLGMFSESRKPLWAAFGLTEPGAGSDVARIRTRVRRDGAAWVITGEKCFCTNAARASWIVIWATIDPALGRSGHRAFVVEKGTPGLKITRIEKKLGLRASETAALVLEDCRVPAENLLGGEAYYSDRKEGFKGAMRALDVTRPVIAANALGIARAAWDTANGFFRDHHRGRTGSRVTRLAEKLGYARRRLEAGRLLAWRAAWMADQRMVNTTEASMAKAFGPMIALECASLALEVLGEAGLRGDYFAEKLYRDVKALDIVEGTGQIQRLIIARKLFNFPSVEEQEKAS